MLDHDPALTQDGTVPKVFKADCSSRLLLDQITDKWSVLILGSLCEKPLRFNEIRRRLDGITQKALTQSLRRLERSGILARRVIASSQVAVEYSITPLGGGAGRAVQGALRLDAQPFGSGAAGAGGVRCAHRRCLAVAALLAIQPHRLRIAELAYAEVRQLAAEPAFLHAAKRHPRV